VLAKKVRCRLLHPLQIERSGSPRQRAQASASRLPRRRRSDPIIALEGSFWEDAVLVGLAQDAVTGVEARRYGLDAEDAMLEAQCAVEARDGGWRREWRRRSRRTQPVRVRGRRCRSAGALG